MEPKKNVEMAEKIRVQSKTSEETSKERIGKMRFACQKKKKQQTMWSAEQLEETILGRSILDDPGSLLDPCYRLPS